jgi:hypothetical protein
MRTYAAASTGSPAAAWDLFARPAAWPTWAPHVRGAWGLGDPEVRRGAIGFARLLGVVPVPARIVAKTPGRSWAWRVGEVVELVHRVEPADGGGCTVSTDLIAPPAIEDALHVAYGPVISWTMRRLAERAAASPPRAR